MANANRNVLKLHLELSECRSRLKRACDQVTLLDDRMDGIYLRYRRAKSEDKMASKYSLYLKLRTTEEVRNTFYMYCCKKADEITYLRFQISCQAEYELVI